MSRRSRTANFLRGPLPAAGLAIAHVADGLREFGPQIDRALDNLADVTNKALDDLADEAKKALDDLREKNAKLRSDVEVLRVMIRSQNVGVTRSKRDVA